MAEYRVTTAQSPTDLLTLRTEPGWVIAYGTGDDIAEDQTPASSAGRWEGSREMSTRRSPPSAIDVRLGVSELDRLIALIDAQGGEGEISDADEALRSKIQGACWELSGAQDRARCREEERRVMEERNAAARPALRAHLGDVA